MGIVFIIALVIAAGVLLWCRRVWCRINRLQEPLSESYAEIDGKLRQRADKIAQLVAVTEKNGIQDGLLFITWQDVYSRYAQAATLNDSVSAANDINNTFYHIMTLVQTHPALIADPQFVRLQLVICDIDDALRPGVDAFNDAVIHYNLSVQRYPDVLIAHLFGFGPKVWLELS